MQARLVAAHEETLQSHASSRQISTNNESYAEELEEELRAVAAERDEALHSLQMVVKEIEGEEERFENELELQRSITVTKSQVRDPARPVTFPMTHYMTRPVTPLWHTLWPL